MGKKLTYLDHMAHNRRVSVLLMFSMTALLGIVGAAMGAAWEQPAAGAVVAVVVAALLMLVSFYGGGSAILAMSGAREIEKKDHPQLFNVVEELSIAAGMPMPRVYIIEEAAPNAFATGRDPKHAAVAITRGLLQKLNRDELQGVMAHEMSHVRNYDIRFAMLMAVMAGAIVLMCDFFWRAAFYGGLGGGRRRSSNDRGGGGAQAVVVVLALALAILAPIFATLIQLAVSRRREYLADASAVELTRQSEGLARALEKIAGDPAPLRAASRATQHLFICNPVKKLGSSDSVFNTHPPIAQRIARLRALGNQSPAATPG